MMRACGYQVAVRFVTPFGEKQTRRDPFVILFQTLGTESHRIGHLFSKRADAAYDGHTPQSLVSLLFPTDLLSALVEATRNCLRR